MDECYKQSDVEQKVMSSTPMICRSVNTLKTKMVTELLAGEEKLQNNTYGRMVLRNCRVNEFKKKRERWESEESVVEKRKRIFADILEDESTPVVITSNSTEKKKKKKEALTLPAAEVSIPLFQHSFLRSRKNRKFLLHCLPAFQKRLMSCRTNPKPRERHRSVLVNANFIYIFFLIARDAGLNRNWS